MPRVAQQQRADLSPFQPGTTIRFRNNRFAFNGIGILFNSEVGGNNMVDNVFEGNLTQQPGTQVSVVVTETGRVKGDITAQTQEVLGHIDRLLAGPEQAAEEFGNFLQPLAAPLAIHYALPKF